MPRLGYAADAAPRMITAGTLMMLHGFYCRSLLAAVTLLALSGCSAQSLEQQSGDEQGPAVASSIAPAGKVVAFIGQDVNSIEAYAAEVAPPAGVVSYTSLGGLEGLAEAHDNGGGLMHLARLSSEFPGTPIALGLYLVDQLPALTSGALDANVDALAAELGSYPTTVLLRVGYEFEAPWSHYDPDQYKLAFARLAQRFEAAGASNVEFVWQAAASCGETFTGSPVEAWYPGDEFVDWIAASYFAQAACQFSPVKRMVHLAREHQKPFLIAESTPQGYDLSDETYSRNGVDRQPKPADAIYDEWYAPYFALVAGSLDVVRAVTYINADWDAQGMWGPPYANGYFGDSRVQANATVLARWRQALSAAHWVQAP